MQFINDPQTIKYRSALQVALDQNLSDLGVFALDMSENIPKRKQANTQLITQGDVEVLNQIMKSIANLHFELRFGEKWGKQDENLKNSVVQAVSENMLKKILASSDPLDEELPIAACSLLDEELAKQTNLAKLIQ
jgi:hypothetical protein